MSISRSKFLIVTDANNSYNKTNQIIKHQP
jgi:hypothetical protein